MKMTLLLRLQLNLEHNQSMNTRYYRDCYTENTNKTNCMEFIRKNECRVPRTHSCTTNESKSIKRLRHSGHFHIHQRSTINPNLNPKFHPTLQYQIQQKLTQTPCKHSAHICLFSTVHCYVVWSNASPLSHLSHGFWPLALLYVILSTSNLYHRKALFFPVLLST